MSAQLRRVDLKDRNARVLERHDKISWKKCYSPRTKVLRGGSGKLFEVSANSRY
jgi:hypothetical protein